jgi:hypothetical protein
MERHAAEKAGIPSTTGVLANGNSRILTTHREVCGLGIHGSGQKVSGSCAAVAPLLIGESLC